MTTIIDRRPNPKGKSLVNRQRFIRRAKEQIREAVKKNIGKTDIKDIGTSGGKISIPTKGITEPTIRNGKGGDKDRVFPGNKEYVEGDLIPKPEDGNGGGRGRQASDSGDGEDEFNFTLSRDEFLNIFFEDLELPDLIKKQLKEVKSYEMKRAGYTTAGNPTNMNLRQTMRNALGRRIALRRPKSDELLELEKKIFELEKKSKKSKDERDILASLHVEAVAMKKRMNGIPFVDPLDVRYNVHIKHPLPSTKAVMFCLMDVSGSMGEREKDLAKRFFMLLHLFLQRHYERIDVVFVRHTTEAQEVDEETFFYDRETGGTRVSSCLELMSQIIQKRYPIEDWNIYAAQASDGDNWGGDSTRCVSLLNEKLMPLLQYFAYIEIADRENAALFSYSGAGELWKSYESVSNQWEKFEMKRIGKASDIFPVFRELFQKE